MFKVMIVDDQALSRQLFELYIKASKKFKLVSSVAEAGSADVYLLKNSVDLIIMDILMSSGPNGLEAAKSIKKKHPEIKIIAVTSMPEYNLIEKAKAYGVESFWYKETDERTLIDVMNRTMAGESVYPTKSPIVKLGNAKTSDFTERELEVLRIITTGAKNSDVAKQLCISENTVKSHVRNMLNKTGYRSRTELAIQARVTGIVLI